jgi:hypothetical protein
MTDRDDRLPQGSLQAVHWLEPLPESVWCKECDARRIVTGFSAGHGRVLGLYLACGHREDPPWDIRAEGIDWADES